jgi:cell division protein FtsQ
VARKPTSTAVQEELYPQDRETTEYSRESRSPEGAPFDDSRLVDLETEQESPFLRGQKRVSVRRGSLPKKTANRVLWALAALAALAVVAGIGLSLYRYGKHSWRFRIDSSDQIEVAGAEHVSHAQIMEVMGGDIGRNIFFIPLEQRQRQLEQIPWVESASVMRFVPNRLRIEIHERTPVAFARIGSHISLIDAGGTLMELSSNGKHKYSFAVIAGMNAGEPLSMRAARMKKYNQLMGDLDADGARYSQELSEVDLGDPEDVKVLVNDPNGEVLVHLGSENFLPRYKNYVTHAEQWRQQFNKLESVDLRYEGQIIVNPDLEGIARQPSLSPAAAKAAVAAGAKTAALVNYEKYVEHPAGTTPAKQAKPKTGSVTAKSDRHAPKKAAKTTWAKLHPKPGTAAAAVKPAALRQPSPSQPAASAPAVPKSQTETAATKRTPVAASKKGVTTTTSQTAPVVATPSPASKKPSAAIPKEVPQN